MKSPLLASERKKVWGIVASFFDALEKSKQIPVSYAIYKLALKIKNGDEVQIADAQKLDYLFIDEAQDLTAAKLFILRHAVTGSIILAGDADQTLYQPSLTWKRAGIDIAGRTKILHTNFRNTNQIHSVAESYRAKTKGYDKETAPTTFRLGSPVELHTANKIEGSYNQIIDTVKLFIKQLSYEPENICVIAQRTNHLEKIKSLLAKELSLNAKIISDSDFDFSTEGIIRLTTTFSCKGLDFPVVLFLLDHRSHITSNYDEETADKINRNLIYTAITRSLEMLHIFTLDSTDAKCITDLKEICAAQ